ncbi:MAG: hypothetical protein GY697_18485 [Desulfobacterales bacterium]|nr:hypothetical protein [Desulfobacterales bacterium]
MIKNCNHIEPAVFASKEYLTFSSPISAIELQTRLNSFLGGLTKALRHNGCLLIGHIKGLVSARDKGHLMFSVTSFGADAHFKGTLTDGAKQAEFTINVIVYGVDKNIIGDLYRKAFAAGLNRATEIARKVNL